MKGLFIEIQLYNLTATTILEQNPTLFLLFLIVILIKKETFIEKAIHVLCHNSACWKTHFNVWFHSILNQVSKENP